MAGLGYPGGPVVDRARPAGGVRPRRSPCRASPTARFDFSFSGLKTAVRDRLSALGVSPADRRPRSHQDRRPWTRRRRRSRDLLADFQEAVVAQLEDRLDPRPRRTTRSRLLTVSGGVAANSLLRERLAAWGTARGVEVLLAPTALTGDNAAMVAFAGLVRFRRGRPGRRPRGRRPAPAGRSRSLE